MDTATPPPDAASAAALATGIAAAVRDTLRESGVTQAELGAATGIPQATLSRRLAGLTPFNAAELGLIAAHLGLKVSDFFHAAERAA